jgi:glycogen debranching enzyme
MYHLSKTIILLVVAIVFCVHGVASAGDGNPFVRFRSGDGTLDRAFRIAMGDLVTNIMPFQSGLLAEERPVVLAGLEYGRPWTRDASINTWNGVGLLYPEVTRDTLLAVLERRDGKVFIGGQYWDCMVWAQGAWSQYLYTGDKTFLATAFEAVANTLEHLEATEFDTDLGLFRGAASSSDGVAGYPTVYAEPGGFSGISDWPRLNPERRHPVGFGVPMHALSTNCLYYRAYKLVQAMATELGQAVNPHWESQAQIVKRAINERFWRADAGLYRYMVDPFGDCDYVECLGQAYAVQFGVADAVQAAAVIENQYVTPAGVPVLWPTFPRYRVAAFQDVAKSGFGRHSGCVWPPFEAIWATAALETGDAEVFDRILKKTAEYACRDNQFVEIYHPLSGLPYGGLQEGGGNPPTKAAYDVAPDAYLIGEWHATVRQTWSATGYVRMLVHGVFGMKFSTEGISFAPTLPKGCDSLLLENLVYRGKALRIEVQGKGQRIARFSINGETSTKAFLPADGKGEMKIQIELKN